MSLRALLISSLFVSAVASAAQVKIAVPPFQRSSEIPSEDASRLAAQLRQRINAHERLELTEVSVGDLLARRGPDLALMGNLVQIGPQIQLKLRLEDWSRPGSTPTVVSRQAGDLLGLASKLDEMILELFPGAGSSPSRASGQSSPAAPSVSGKPPTKGSLKGMVVGSGGAALLVSGAAYAYSRLVNLPELVDLRDQAESRENSQADRQQADDDFHVLDGQDRSLRSISLGLGLAGGGLLIWGFVL